MCVSFGTLPQQRFGGRNPPETALTAWRADAIATQRANAKSKAQGASAMKPNTRGSDRMDLNQQTLVGFRLARGIVLGLAIAGLMVPTAGAATRSMTGTLMVDNVDSGIEGGPGVFGRKVGGIGPRTFPPTDGAKTISVDGATRQHLRRSTGHDPVERARLFRSRISRFPGLLERRSGDQDLHVGPTAGDLRGEQRRARRLPRPRLHGRRRGHGDQLVPADRPQSYGSGARNGRCTGRQLGLPELAGRRGRR